jgi:hypothetical protein
MINTLLISNCFIVLDWLGKRIDFHITNAEYALKLYPEKSKIRIFANYNTDLNEKN